MGNCCRRCFGVLDRRKYLQSKYTAEQEFSIEVLRKLGNVSTNLVEKKIFVSLSLFENLMDEEPQRIEMTRGQLALDSGPFTVSSYVQRLAEQEHEIVCGEEGFSEGRPEAARVAKLNRDNERSAIPSAAINKACLNDDEWEIAGGEDDFEIFLANVKARSLAAQSQVKNGDAHSSSSSNALTKEKSFTEGSSIDLSWDHETEVSPRRKVYQRVSEDSWSKPSTTSPMHSSDLEWDPDFVSAEDNERMQLLNAATSHVSSR